MKTLDLHRTVPITLGRLEALGKTPSALGVLEELGVTVPPTPVTCSRYCRAANRYGFEPWIVIPSNGFRLARPAEAPVGRERA